MRGRLLRQFPALMAGTMNKSYTSIPVNHVVPVAVLAATTRRSFSTTALQLAQQPQGISRHATREAMKDIHSGGDGLESESAASKVAQQLNQLKREYKKEKDKRKQKAIGSDARKLLLKTKIDITEPSEKTVALMLNSAAFFQMHADTPVVLQCVEWMLENLEGCEAQHVALFVHAVASIKLPNAQEMLLQKVLPRLEELLPTMLPVELAMVFQAFVRLGLHDHALCSQILVTLGQSIDSVKVGELATVFTSLASTPRPFIWTPERKAFMAQAFLLTAKNASGLFQGPLVGMLKAIADLEVYPGGNAEAEVTHIEEALDALYKRVTEVNLVSSELPDAFAALSKIGCRHQGAWDKVNERLSVTGKFLSLEELKVIIQATVSCPERPAALSEIMVPSVLERKLGKATEGEIASLLWVAALHSTSWREALLQGALTAVGKKEPSESNPALMLKILLAARWIQKGNELELATLEARLIDAVQRRRPETANQYIQSIAVMFHWSPHFEQGKPPSTANADGQAVIKKIVGDILGGIREKGFFDHVSAPTLEGCLKRIPAEPTAPLVVAGVKILNPPEIKSLRALLAAAHKIQSRAEE